MTAFIFILFIIVVAALAVPFGADSRNLAGTELERDKFWARSPG